MGTLKKDFYQLIKTQECLLEFILESAPKGVWCCHLENYKHLWTSPEWQQALGYTAHQQISDCREIIDESSLQQLVANLDGKNFDPSAQYQLNYKHQDGSTVTTYCTGMIGSVKKGAPLLLVLITQINSLPVFTPSDSKTNGHSVTLAREHQHLNEKLRLSEERFRRAFEHAAIGMAIVSLKGKWMRINSSLYNILGYRPSELMKLTFQDITYPEDLDKDLNLLNDVIAGIRESYQMEKRYFHKKGHVVWVMLAVSLVKNSDGEPLHFISQITDISKVKAAESEMKSVLEVTSDQNRRLLNFAHIVSHNLRSHSGNLSMLLNFIETDVDEQSRQELFKMFRHAASNLQETIGHLNEVVAVNTTISANLVKVNLNRAINGAIGNIEALLKAANAICINEVKTEIMVNAIPAYLDSILLNFLTNAIKYRSADRQLIIELSAQIEDRLVILTIQDNGLGIDLQLNRDKLFGMYKTFHTNKDARGIGLFITKNQIEAMGGKVSVDSVVGEGTSFKIYFIK
uniref:sensor histidine kinase n=1 Tax=Pedobacter schmidteae TaxID=2201271 RepID=UPI0018D50BD7|nr:HAMP domain-containing sensor histidine kinase [Pedobacter schmidteae]